MLGSPGAHGLVERFRGTDFFAPGPDAHGHIADRPTVLHDWSDVRAHPVIAAVLASVLNHPGPRLAPSDRLPEICERLARHVRMAHDVLRLADAFLQGELAAREKRLVRVSDSAVEIRSRDDHIAIWQDVLFIRDGQIHAHISSSN